MRWVWVGTQGFKTREKARQQARETRQYFDPTRPHLRWRCSTPKKVARYQWEQGKRRHYWTVEHYVWGSQLGKRPRTVREVRP